MRILLIDEDRIFREWLAALLRDAALAVDVFESPHDLRIERINAGGALIVVGLPPQGIDGSAVLNDFVRGHPCVVMASDDREAERIVALELGADDVIDKRAQPREIIARVNAVLRRTQREPDAPHAAGWRFTPAHRELLRPDGSPVMLTAAEFALLEHFVGRKGEEVGREELFKVVFRRPFNPLDRAIDTLVVKLRRKLGDTTRDGRMISTIRLRGYVFQGFPAEP